MEESTEVEGPARTWGPYSSFGAVLRALRKARHLRQLDLGERVFVDHTIISRLETGALLPSAELLTALITTLAWDHAERQWLETAYGAAMLMSGGLRDYAPIHGEELLRMAGEGLELSRSLRERGDSQLAALSAHNEALHLEYAARQPLNERLREQLLKQLGELLFQEGKCYLDYLPSEAIRTCVPALHRKHKAIAVSLRDSRLSLLNHILAEGLLYFGGNYSEANNVCHSLLASDELDDDWLPEVVRAAIINAGHLHDESELQTQQWRMGRLLESTTPALDRVFLLEGLARAQAEIGLKEALDTVERAWGVVESSKQAGEYSSLRYVQLIRAHLRVNERFSRKNETWLERRAEEALLICRHLSYGRYNEEISRTLEGDCLRG